MKKWNLKKLGEVCDFSNGQAHEKCIDENGKYKLINSKFVSTDGETFKRTNNALSPLFVNDIAMVMSDVPNGKTLAKCFVVDKNDTYTLNQRICVIRSKNFDTQFLYYQLNRNKYLLSFDNGENQSNLRKNDILNCELLVPPFPEQQRIVSILDECFEAIDTAKANAEQNLKNAKELFESYLQGVFESGDWEVKVLDEVCEISSKLIDPRKPEFQNLIHIGAGNIESQTGILSDLKTAKEENLISGKFLFDESMVLYSKIRPYLMKVVNCDFEGLCSADIYPLKPFEKLISKNYLYHLLLTKEFTDYAILGSQRAGMPKVNREHLFAYKLKLPPLQEQETIVSQLDALLSETQKLEAIYQQKLADLEELKKSVLQKAFAGELKGREVEV
ncbi:restriction endonuclease subunit S [Algoriphagus persicinus]|uniref:restriction endonuclease subunit S n=1 Tax=Algoriphagus persicinus TaxID=3108754 RepID=UPI002B3B0F14|nr:restriction endonuclease subunit S [Algoriphagus sp. E1-3-M2]MEB2785564.1 restriction endonuclease subunit S [Algoriphagus sp. E1-3-M2]